MLLAHKIAIDPTVAQRILLAQHAGTARFVYNWGLAEWNRQYKCGLKPTANKLAVQFNAVKYEFFPWLAGVARDAHSRPFADLQVAFSRFFNKLSKRPRFKRKGKSRDSFYVRNDRIQLDGNRVRIPVIGWLRLREPLRFTGKIMSARVSRTADRWFISINVEVGDYEKPRISDREVGIDLGITSFAVTSSGDVFDAPKPLGCFLTKLARFQRSFARKQKGSKNREKLRVKIARLHARIASIRSDFIHKLSTKLCRENQAVVLEDLSVAGMVRNRKLSRAISDLGWGEFRRQLVYKSLIYGTELLFVDRWFPSSKTCSNCGKIKDSLSLSQRTFRCECGLQIDRDLNAAKNIFTAGLAGRACGPEGSGRDENITTKPCRVEARTKPCPLSDTC